MQAPTVEYRRVKLPRTDMLFSVCWFDIDESLDIFVRFAETAPAEKLGELLESIGYEPLVHMSMWAAPGDAEPLVFHEVLIYLTAPKSCQQIWATGAAISEVEANTRHQRVEELSR
jgi:hypothetical protein